MGTKHTFGNAVVHGEVAKGWLNEGFPKGYSTPCQRGIATASASATDAKTTCPLDQPTDITANHATDFEASTSEVGTEGVVEARAPGQAGAGQPAELSSTGASPTGQEEDAVGEKASVASSAGTQVEADPVETAERKPRRSSQPPSHPELWASYRLAPGDDTRNELVVAYHGLVRDVVRRFSARLPRSVDRGDLITAGSVGLMSAIEGFDPERGVRFESYCELRVKGALLDELRTQDWLPRPWRQRVELQKRTVEQLRSKLGRRPDDQEVAEVMGLGIDTYRQVFGTGLPNAPTGSMASGDDDDGAITMEVVPDRQSEAPDERLSREELLALVAQKLTQQEYRIVYLKYWEELPMREIGELTGLSESRVCKIHAKLILRLRDRFRSDLDVE